MPDETGVMVRAVAWASAGVVVGVIVLASLFAATPVVSLLLAWMRWWGL